MRTALLLLACLLALPAAGEPIRLHPENPHYFLFEGRPTVLISSAEHYGAVMNLEFDYLKYLDALKAKGFNYTKIFSGAYREIPGSFGIERNDLAPGPGHYVCPWARSGEDGYAIGGKKFDLTKWDPAYFKRLKDYVGAAGRRGIVVEISLFCPFYPRKNEKVNLLWQASPMNVANNVNGVGGCDSQKANTLENGNLLAVQEAMVRKIVGELNGCDNVIYEICNEPYFGGVTEDWQAHIAGVIAEVEKGKAGKHLISQNIANSYKKIEQPNPLVSVFNFHYAAPRAVSENFELGRVIGLDETGFRGSGAEPYRVEAWQFMMAGGGLYNNLDYGYTVKSPEGRDQANKAPGSNTLEMRDQLVVLREFFAGLDFVKMKPADGGRKPTAPGGVMVEALAKGDEMVAYFATKVEKAGKPITFESKSEADKAGSGKAREGLETTVELAAGKWAATWISPLTGKAVKTETFEHRGGKRVLKLPAFKRDVALRLARQ